MCDFNQPTLNFDYCRDSSLKFNQEYSEQLIDDGRVFKKIQGLCLPEPP